MSATETILYLTPEIFGEKENTLLENGPMAASTFRFDSGVSALRLKNELGDVVLLPYQGQQIWSAEFGGRNLAMKSMFSQPHPTRQYLETYGAFLLHCGATAMGVPSRDDTHPLHGELPNAPYQRACLAVGNDQRGDYLALGGQYQHTVAFNHNYLAEPWVRLYAGSSLLSVSMAITNLKRTEMEFMYMAHVNFRPVDHGRLVYSVVPAPERIRVRTSIPAHIRPLPGYVEFINQLKQHPEKHHVLAPGLMFDPEVVFFLDYVADEDGWAHSMQVHPDGSADYIRHRPKELDKGIRWISRTPDQDALGIVLPATAEPEGYLAEKAKGNLKIIPPGGAYRFELEMGLLSPHKAREMEEKIAKLVRN